ncbi:unnamed protein product [Chilo suppressalis]|uniref:HAT C-terminal dimerisation domain-containing protein n=1 Tax=Chilo suppressalis TaxID=168631 RepID=A0ABN8AP58_CHISP|nr:unnamed protein product [Chilo suppressalis]
MYTRSAKQSKAATIASFKISHILAKHKKAFEDGSVLMEAGETLFGDFKNKTLFMSAIRKLQLSRLTVTRRIEVISQDMADKLKHDIMECTYFSLQFDESTDMTDTVQLCIFIRMVFNYMLAKEEFLTFFSLKGKTPCNGGSLSCSWKIAEHTDLVLHTDVRWLSRGKFLERFQELLPEITAFLDERGDDTQMLKNEKWLTDLTFLTDITMHLNTINLELQGKGKTIIEMISAVNAFKSKLQLMIDQLRRKDLKHFPSLKARIPQLNYDTYEAELSNILGQFEMRFYVCSKLANIASFMTYPFSCKNIEELATEIATQFNMNSCSDENELVQIISDIHLKATASDTNFWCFISEDKYPNLRKIALQLTAMFGSTYLCESAFCEMKIIKSKYRNRLTDNRMSSCLRLALSGYVPSYENLNGVNYNHNKVHTFAPHAFGGPRSLEFVSGDRSIV